MIALLADEDFNGRILRGLRRQLPDVNLTTVGDVGLTERPDTEILAWAAAHARVIVTHDVNTLIAAAIERVRLGEPMSGVVAVPQQVGIGVAISALALIVNCAETRELEGQIWYLPL